MDLRRKRLLFRTQHCGIKENDILLGQFMAKNCETLNESDIGAFEALLNESDNDIYSWITGREKPPRKHATPLLHALIAFNRPKPK